MSTLKIAVIGSGVSGLGSAFILSGKHRVYLFEKDKKFGGHSNTITINKKGLIFYPNDITIKQFDQKSERVLIFIVDSSGSNAIGRLAEAKGAVEILLSDAYAKRDNVALISFGGDDAKTLLLI